MKLSNIASAAPFAHLLGRRAASVNAATAEEKDDKDDDARLSDDLSGGGQSALGFEVSGTAGKRKKIQVARARARRHVWSQLPGGVPESACGATTQKSSSPRACARATPGPTPPPTTSTFWAKPSRRSPPPAGVTC